MTGSKKARCFSKRVLGQNRARFLRLLFCNKMKIEASVHFGGRDEEVEVYGKLDRGVLGRRRSLQEVRQQQCLVLPVDEQVVGRLGQRAQTGSGAGSREQPAREDVCRAGFREHSNQGYAFLK